MRGQWLQLWSQWVCDQSVLALVVCTPSMLSAPQPTAQKRALTGMGPLTNGSVVGTRSGYVQLPAGGKGWSGRKRTKMLALGPMGLGPDLVWAANR